MWHYKTRKGVVYLIKRGSRYHVIYQNEDLGDYPSPQQAIDDVVGGHTESPSNGVDLEEMNLPDDLEDWTPGRP